MKRYQLHYKKCIYPGCGLTNQKIDSQHISFFKFPSNDERCKTWLINCKLDDWMEMSSTQLKNKYLCGRHFSKDSFHASGQLRNNAVPKIVDSLNENSGSETSTDIEKMQ